MRPRDKAESNDKREVLFAAADWRCVVCGRPLREGIPMLAHRVIASKYNVKTYGTAMIHHSMNLVPVESLRCNDMCILNFQPASDLLGKIQLIIAGLDIGPDLVEHYRELREELMGRQR